jgi:hypothetical protein
MTMLLPAAVGANLWLVAVLLPLVLQRGWVTMPGRGLVTLAVMMVLPVAALGFGLRRRSLLFLFVGFPFACALPELLMGAGQPDLVGPAPLPLVAVVLVGYLLASAHALARADAAEDRAPQSSAPLPSAVTPLRWQRRIRVYRASVVLAGLIPSVLLFWTLGWPATRESFEASFGTHHDEALAAAAAGVGLLWVVLYRLYFLGPLEGHLHHDRELRVQLEIAKRQAKRGRPRPAFYFAVVAALLAMGAVLWQRSQ